MLLEELNKYNIVLGSASPRRKNLLSSMGIKFSIKTTDEKEYYPKKLITKKIPIFLAQQKAKFISKKLFTNYLLITADTVVSYKDSILHKPTNTNEAREILKELAGTKHKVISAVCIKSKKKEVVFSSETEVFLNHISLEEINYYIKKFKPFDKAGSYGIQEWIGHIGINNIKGSYNNVVGLPTAALYQKLKLFI